MSGAAPAARRPAIPPPPAPGGAAPAARAPAPRALPAAGRGAPRSAGLGRTPGGGERAGAGRERVGGGRDAPPCRGSGQSCCPFRAPGAFGDVAAPQGGASPGHPTQRPVGGARAPLRARTRLWARPLPRLRWRGTGSPFPAGPAWGRAHRLLPRAPLAPPQIPGAWGGVVLPDGARESGVGGGRWVPGWSPSRPGPRPGENAAGGGARRRESGTARLGSDQRWWWWWWGVTFQKAGQTAPFASLLFLCQPGAARAERVPPRQAVRPRWGWGCRFTPPTTSQTVLL